MDSTEAVYKKGDKISYVEHGLYFSGVFEEYFNDKVCVVTLDKMGTVRSRQRIISVTKVIKSVTLNMSHVNPIFAYVDSKY